MKGRRGFEIPGNSKYKKERAGRINRIYEFSTVRPHHGGYARCFNGTLHESLNLSFRGGLQTISFLIEYPFFDRFNFCEGTYKCHGTTVSRTRGTWHTCEKREKTHVVRRASSKIGTVQESLASVQVGP